MQLQPRRLRSSRRNNEAKLHYEWAIRHCTWNPILVSNACNFLREQNKNNEALILLQRALERWPKDIHLRWGLVLSMHYAGSEHRALTFLEELLEEEGERPLLLEEKIACLLGCNRTKKH